MGTIKKLLNSINPPCPKCPYTLGFVKTIENPCPQCKGNGYRTFEMYQKANRQRS